MFFSSKFCILVSTWFQLKYNLGFISNSARNITRVFYLLLLQKKKNALSSETSNFFELTGSFSVVSGRWSTDSRSIITKNYLVGRIIPKVFPKNGVLKNVGKILVQNIIFTQKLLALTYHVPKIYLQDLQSTIDTYFKFDFHHLDKTRRNFCEKTRPFNTKSKNNVFLTIFSLTRKTRKLTTSTSNLHTL